MTHHGLKTPARRCSPPARPAEETAGTASRWLLRVLRVPPRLCHSTCDVNKQNYKAYRRAGPTAVISRKSTSQCTSQKDTSGNYNHDKIRHHNIVGELSPRAPHEKKTATRTPTRPRSDCRPTAGRRRRAPLPASRRHCSLARSLAPSDATHYLHTTREPQQAGSPTLAPQSPYVPFCA